MPRKSHRRRRTRPKPRPEPIRHGRLADGVRIVLDDEEDKRCAMITKALEGNRMPPIDEIIKIESKRWPEKIRRKL